MKRILQAIIFGVLALAGASAGAAELRIGVRTEPVMDPHFMWTDANVSYYIHIFGGLTVSDEHLQVHPGLAESWVAVSDTEWRFNLRKAAKFHDGSPVAAQDVVDSFARMRTIKAAAPFTGAIAGLKDVKAIDDHTVSITTTKPNPLVPQRVSLIHVVPSQIAKSATSEDFTSGRAVIGSGPYKLVSFQAGNSLVLARNPNHWGKPAKWDKVTFRFIPDNAARVAALLSKDVDMIDGVLPSLVGRLRGEPDVNVVTGPSSRIISLTLDSERDQTPFIKGLDGAPLAKNPLKDKRVREAFSLAIDRQAIVDRVLGGLGFPTGQLTPKGFGGYNDMIPIQKPDVARAKKLLAEAGYLSGFQMTIHCTNDRYVEDANICQALGQMFARIGLKVDVVTMPGSVLTPKAMDAKGERFSVAMLGWSDSSGEALVLGSVIHTYDPPKGFGTWNWGHYSNPKVDAVIETSSSVLDTPKRHSILAEAMKAAMDDYAMIPLHNQSVIVGLRKGLTYKAWATDYTIADSVSVAGN